MDPTAQNKAKLTEVEANTLKTPESIDVISFDPKAERQEIEARVAETKDTEERVVDMIMNKAEQTGDQEIQLEIKPLSEQFKQGLEDVGVEYMAGVNEVLGDTDPALKIDRKKSPEVLKKEAASLVAEMDNIPLYDKGVNNVYYHLRDKSEYSEDDIKNLKYVREKMLKEEQEYKKGSLTPEGIDEILGLKPDKIKVQGEKEPEQPIKVKKPEAEASEDTELPQRKGLFTGRFGEGVRGIRDSVGEKVRGVSAAAFDKFQGRFLDPKAVDKLNKNINQQEQYIQAFDQKYQDLEDEKSELLDKISKFEALKSKISLKDVMALNKNIEKLTKQKEGVEEMQKRAAGGKVLAERQIEIYSEDRKIILDRMMGRIDKKMGPHVKKQESLKLSDAMLAKGVEKLEKNIADREASKKSMKI